jgi:hypothetical protein
MIKSGINMEFVRHRDIPLQMAWKSFRDTGGMRYH